MKNCQLMSDRHLGCLIGLAVGDALGATTEFSEGPQEIADMVGGGPFNLEPGQFTDDTSMALCLADSLVTCGRFDPLDQLERYGRWLREGYMSCKGHAFDVGGTVRRALEAFEQTRSPHREEPEKFEAANGSLMRLAPVPMAYATEPARAIELSGESSLTTHSLPICVDACRYFGSLIAAALRGVRKDELLSSQYSLVSDYWEEHPLSVSIAEIRSGLFRIERVPAARGNAHAPRSLETALWAFYHTDTFEEGCYKAVNVGGDSDTIGAIYGQLAGAYYGATAIPNRWTEKLAMRDTIVALASGLFDLARKNETRKGLAQR